MIDVERQVIETDADLDAREAAPMLDKGEQLTGVYAKYAALVGSASQGAVTSGADQPFNKS